MIASRAGDREPTDVRERIALGFVEAERQRRTNLEGAEVVEIDGLFLAFGNVPDPPVNSVLVISKPRDPVGALAAAEEAFRDHDRQFGMDVEVGRHPSVDRAIRSAGLSRLFSWPAMAVSVVDLPERSVPEGIRVEPVTDARGMAAVTHVERTLLGPEQIEMGSKIAERFYGPASLGPEDARTFVAWEDEEPVGISTAHLREGAVGIFGLGVVPGARRRGIASALSVIAARAFPADLAWLRASDAARTLYGSLGFRRVANWEVWGALALRCRQAAPRRDVRARGDFTSNGRCSMSSRIVALFIVAASFLGLDAIPTVADEIAPSPEFGTHVSQMAPEHPLEHGAMFGECLSTMATGGDCPDH